MSLRVRPLTLRYANHLVDEWHRHHKPARGQRFSLGVYQDGEIVGAAIVSRPVARGCDPQLVAEVTRLVTNGTKNACSILYAAAARACREMGFEKIQTYILESESGTSLIAAGWEFEGMTAGGTWASSERYKAQGRRRDQPEEPKQRWAKQLTR
jgi:hypothetical protein